MVHSGGPISLPQPGTLDEVLGATGSGLVPALAPRGAPRRAAVLDGVDQHASGLEHARAGEVPEGQVGVIVRAQRVPHGGFEDLLRAEAVRHILRLVFGGLLVPLLADHNSCLPGVRALHCRTLARLLSLLTLLPHPARFPLLCRPTPPARHQARSLNVRQLSLHLSTLCLLKLRLDVVPSKGHRDEVLLTPAGSSIPSIGVPKHEPFTIHRVVLLACASITV
mmetsp:Transcript_29621/g.83557  ORF Transcript_29621/g.83557 Transcript_29621/m.83557 type:complete len:223 (-) Transcript_29621:256-924(-)